MEPHTTEIHQIALLKNILLRSILPIACSAAIGFLISRWGRFGLYPYVLQFVSDATVASLFFYSLSYLRKRDAYAVLLILFLLTLLFTGSTRPMYVLRDLLNTFGLAAAVVFYERLVRRNPDLQHQYYGLVFSGMLGVCNIVAWCLQFFFVEFVFSKHQAVDFVRFVSFAAFVGFFVGLGVGVGIVVNQFVFKGARNLAARG